MLLISNNKQGYSKKIRTILYVVVFICLSPLLWLSGFQLVEDRFYDWFSTTYPPKPEQTPVIIVAIDEPSFAELSLQWPWPRELHGRLIDSLTKAGASVIALDIIFAEPSNNKSDKSLAQSISRAKQVILASEETIEESPLYSQHMRIDPLELFINAGAISGLASVTLDRDSVLRKLPNRDDTFAALALKLWQQTHKIEPLNFTKHTKYATKENALIQYFGTSRSYPSVSYYQALDPDKYLPQGIFENRLVIVGKALKTATTPEVRQVDAFATPFTFSSRILTAGSEVQATIIDNLRLGLFNKKQAISKQLLTLAITLILCWFLFQHWRPIKGIISTIFLIILICSLSFYLLRYQQLWLAPTLSLLAIIFAFLTENGIAFLSERRDKHLITQAFSHYLSPKLVEQLASDPSLLKLGGESRQMTIMFCDVRGFTALSESFSSNPSDLTQLLNRFLTSMTDAVLKNGGTVDKYIGDCIMAFWNAPLNDPYHAKNACTAALNMLKNLQQLNLELENELKNKLISNSAKAKTNLQLKVGLGINTGLCVVGNIGSDQRFDYSVLGDSVNLASRLEGQSKIYGVDIVLGQDTVKQISGYALLELDWVAVKGKTEAVHIYALVGDESYCQKPEFQSLTKQHSEMLHAYRKQQWQEAKQLIRMCIKLAPEFNTLYRIYLQRIDEFEKLPPSLNWCGIFVAQSK